MSGVRKKFGVVGGVQLRMLIICFSGDKFLKKLTILQPWRRAVDHANLLFLREKISNVVVGGCVSTLFKVPLRLS